MYSEAVTLRPVNAVGSVATSRMMPVLVLVFDLGPDTQLASAMTSRDWVQPYLLLACS